MYSVTISMSAISSEAFELVKLASQEVVAPSSAEPGCVFFDVLFNEEERALRFYEAYTSRAAFEAHLKAEHTLAWVERCMSVTAEGGRSGRVANRPDKGAGVV